MKNKNNVFKLYLSTALLCSLVMPAASNTLGLSTARAASKARAASNAPNAYELTILVNATLNALNQANQTGNYSVLHDLGAPAFKRLNTGSKLRQIFAGQRARKLDISAVLLYAPVFSKPPKIDKNGYLHLQGHMPTEPFHMNFNLVFEKSGSHWRIMALSVAPAISQRQVIAQK